MKYKFALSALILALLIWYVGVDSLLSVLVKVSFLDIFLLATISVVMIWMSAKKWSLFLEAGGEKVPVKTLMAFYTTGYFFNSFLPSYFGGDIARSVALGTKIKSQRVAAVSTILERVSGIFAMSFIAIISLLLGASVPLPVTLFLLLVGCVCLVANIVFASEAATKFVVEFTSKFVEKFGPERLSQKVSNELERLTSAAAYARGNHKLWLMALLWSFLFHCMTVINTYVASVAVGWYYPDFVDLFVILPIILLLSAIPITPSNIGVQESAFLFFLQAIGASRSEGLAVGIVLRIKVLILAVVGALIWSQSSEFGQSRKN